MRNAFKVVRETRKGYERFKLDGYDRFLMERDALNERTWFRRRPMVRVIGYRGWAEKFRWERFFYDV